MKSTNDDEKMVSPMFPRLHVNDTEKGGPRPPPRNKMALYEQLSVPTQKFNSGSASGFPLPPNSTGTLVPSQGGRNEWPLFSSFSIPSTSAARGTSAGMGHLSSTAEPGSFYPHQLSNSRITRVNNKLGNENDFRVPTFVDSGFGSCSSKDEHCLESERHTRFSPNHPGHCIVTPVNSLPKAAAATYNSTVQIQNAQDKHLKRTKSLDLRLTQQNQKESVISKNVSENIASYSLTREKIAERLNLANASPTQENQRSTDDMQALHDFNAQLNHDRVRVLPGKEAHCDGISTAPIEDMQKVHALQLKNDSCSRAFLGSGHGIPNELLEDNTGGLFQVRDVDRNDDVSETSMVDSLSGLDISPDDVVGVIGKKHFWKARRAIVNQQRLFAVQVFELHRLIKVQRLIAESPHLLAEDGAYLSKHPLKASPAKKLPSEYVLKSPQQLLKPRDLQKLNENIECAAENVVGMPPLPSVGDVNRGLVGQLQYSGNAPPFVATDDKLGWHFHPPPGNQWLIPMMSPSEGLVYKPWTGPCPPTTGFMAPVYGGCGPMNLPPAYGIPASHPQGFGLFSGSPFAQSYSSPYNMPVMNPAFTASVVEQVSPLAGARPYRQAEPQVSTGEVNFNKHSRNSCNIPNQKSEAISCFQKFRTSKESEIQGSTASSPSERAQGADAVNVSDGKDALPLFPVASAMQDPPTEYMDKQHARVIKVVPHNPRSAPESAARIFQSIQQERKQ